MFGFQTQEPIEASIEARASIANMRDAFVRSRLTPRVDPHAACAQRPRALNGRAAGPALVALMRAMDQALERKVCFLCPRATSTSFDERWLLRLLERIEAGDLDSARVLIGSRVKKRDRRAMLALAVRASAERVELGQGEPARYVSSD